MQLFRQSRLTTALIALVSMLFVQLAVAAYACPSRQIVQAAEAAAELAAMSVHADEHQDMAECEGVDNGTALCHVHCQPDTQSLDKPQLPDVSPFMAIALVSSVIDVVFSDPPLISRRDDLFLRRTTSPPLSIQNCCFRI